MNDIRSMLDRVEVNRVTHDDPVIQAEFPNHVAVVPIWKGVDRPAGGGIIISADQKLLIERTRRCMEAGAYWSAAEIKTDVNGKTYVLATSRVWGKRLNADLTRIGF